MRLVPAPGAFDDLPNIRKLRYPAKFLPNFAAGGNQHRRIARSARPDFRMDLLPRYLARGIDHFLDGESLPIAQIVHAAATVQRAECQNVRLREIQQMNIIADTGAVARRIVSS